MPGAILAAYKLPELAGAPDKEVAGDLETFYGFIVGVLAPVKLVGEEALHRITAIGARGQADGVNDDEINPSRRGPLAIVGGWQLAGEPVPAIAPQGRRC